MKGILYKIVSCSFNNSDLQRDEDSYLASKQNERKNLKSLKKNLNTENQAQEKDVFFKKTKKN